MRFHVLGVGAIGTLVSFHLKRTARQLAVAVAEADASLRGLPPLPKSAGSGSSSSNSSSTSKILSDASSPYSPPSASMSTSSISKASLAITQDAKTWDEIASKNADFLGSFPYRRALRLLARPDKIGVILQLQKDTYLKAARQVNHGVVVERDGVRQRERGFGYGIVEQRRDTEGNAAMETTLFRPEKAEDGRAYALGTSLLEDRGYPEGTIDSLIVTTKANRTLAAIKTVADKITPATTIVLLQNGQGVLDQLLENVFPDPEKRPNFILASTTHGAFTKNKHHSVHAAVGRIELGVVPSPSLGTAFERLLDSDKEKVEDDELRDTPPPTPSPSLPRGVMIPRKGNDLLSKATTATINKRGLPKQPQAIERDERTEKLNKGLTVSPDLDLGAIPQNDRTITLVQTMAMFLNLPLAVHWHPIRRYQLMAMRKLVVNACINPLTAIVDCRNGELFGNRYAEQTIRDVCREVHNILLALADRAHQETLDQHEKKEHDEQLSSSSAAPDISEDDIVHTAKAREDGKIALGKVMSPLAAIQDYLSSPSTLFGDKPPTDLPVLDPSLSERALVQEVHRVIRLTAPNFSSMLQDMKNSKGDTEIAFINGYIGRLGRALGVPTPVNDTLTRIVQLKGTKTSTTWAGPRTR